MGKLKVLGFILVVLVLVAIPLMGACAAPPPAPPPSPPAEEEKPPEAPPKILKIGCTAPMHMPEGIQIKNWLELFAEDLNNHGGLLVKGQRYNVEVIVYDDGYTADGGKAAAERLVYEDKVKFIVAQWGSAPILGALTVCEPNKVLQFCNGMTEKFMDPQYHYIFRTTSLFWLGKRDEGGVKAMKDQGYAPTVVLLNPDNIPGKGFTMLLSKIYANLGVEVLDALFWKEGTADYTPFATKIKSINPGFVDTGCTPAGAPTLLTAKALYDVGYEGGQVYHNIETTLAEIVDKIGAEACEGWICEFKDPRGYVDDPEMMRLCDLYEEKYGVWETDACNWVSGWFFFVEAIKKADSLDPDDVARAMQGLEVQTLVGKVRMVARPDVAPSFTRTADSCQEYALGIVSNGKMEIYERYSIDGNHEATIRVHGMEEAYK